MRAEIGNANEPSFIMNLGPEMPAAIASGLRVARNAQINGQLSYASTADQGDEILSQPAGGVVFQALPVAVTQNEGIFQTSPVAAPVQPLNMTYDWFLDRIRDFISVFVVGLAALWLVRPRVLEAVSHARTKPLASAGWGILVLFVGYALGAIAFFGLLLLGIMLGLTTLGGLAVTSLVLSFAGSALYVTLFTGLVVWGTKVVVSLLIGKLLLGRFAQDYADSPVTAFLLGLVLFEIVAAIPILGFIVTIVTVLLGLGAMWYVFYDRRRTHSVGISKPAPVPA